MEAYAELSDRMKVLERRVQRYQVLLGLLIVVVPGAAILTPAIQAQDQGVLRAKALIIEDASGRTRIRIGAPLPEVSGRISPCTGMRIDDAQGVERFVSCLYDNGRVGIGLDAPVGKGDDRNRERINIVADAEGGAYIRFLNRKTTVPGRLVLGADDKLYVEFNQSVDGKVRVKRIGFDGERVSDLQ